MKNVFKPTTITAPDGQVMEAWELWTDGRLFGRGSDKDSLLQALTHQQELAIPENRHWRRLSLNRRAGHKLSQPLAELVDR